MISTIWGHIGDIEKLQTQITEYESQLMILRRHNDDLDTQIKTSHAKISTLENSLTSSQKEIGKLTELNMKLQKEKQDLMKYVSLQLCLCFCGCTWFNRISMRITVYVCLCICLLSCRKAFYKIRGLRSIISDSCFDYQIWTVYDLPNVWWYKWSKHMRFHRDARITFFDTPRRDIIFIFKVFVTCRMILLKKV